MTSELPQTPPWPGRPTGFSRRRVVQALAGAAMAASGWAPSPVHAHELQANRLTLVLRDGLHLHLTLQLELLEALHQSLAPQQPLQAFVLQHAPWSRDALSVVLSRTYSLWVQGIRLQPEGQAALRMGRWNWPSVDRVSALLQKRAMQLLADPGAHAHPEPVEVRSEALASKEITELKVTMPQAFGKVLVVSYRPRQVWVAPGEASAPVIFGR